MKSNIGLQFKYYFLLKSPQYLSERYWCSICCHGAVCMDRRTIRGCILLDMPLPFKLEIWDQTL